MHRLILPLLLAISLSNPSEARSVTLCDLCAGVYVRVDSAGVVNVRCPGVATPIWRLTGCRNPRVRTLADGIRLTCG